MMIGSLLLYNLKLNCSIFFRCKQLTNYIYMDIYCKLSKCIGQTPCSYEHYLVITDSFGNKCIWLNLYDHGQAFINNVLLSVMKQSLNINMRPIADH